MEQSGDAEMQENEKTEEIKQESDHEESDEQEEEGLTWLQKATNKLKKLKYHIVVDKDDGQSRMLQIADDSKFKFKDQKHYDKLGDILCEWVQASMVDTYKMTKVMVPFDDELTEGRAQAPIFVSHDWETNTERALVLIQGTGDVRSGYWARSVCMNDTIELGSMLPELDFAQKYGFSVIVFNPNYSKDSKGTLVDNQIRGMNHHSNYCWEKFVEGGKWPAKEIYMVAHSAGGGCAHEIIATNQETMLEKVRAVALTDACHGDIYRDMDSESGRNWVKKSCIAYDASNKTLGKTLSNHYYTPKFPCVSAGHTKHVYTTGCARVSYLPWFLKRSSIPSEDEA